MQLRLRRANRATEYPRDLFVLESFDVMQYEYVLVTFRQLVDGVLERYLVDDRHLVRVGGPRHDLVGRFTFLGRLIEFHLTHTKVH